MRFVLLVALAGCNTLLGVHTFDREDAGADDAASACAATCTDPHATCVAQGCACVAGYTHDGTSCQWTGVVANPTFMDTTAWTLRGLTIDPIATAPGMLEAGYASPLCGNSMYQDIVMPRRERAEPLVFYTSYGSPSPVSLQLRVDLGTAYHLKAFGQLSGTGFVKVRWCVGEGQYAGAGSRAIGEPLRLTLAGTYCSGGGLDHFDIVKANAGECPDVGKGLNGNAEGAGGWDFSAPPDGSSANIVGAVGENGTAGVRLYGFSRCSSASGAIPLSVPVVASPALSLYRATKSNGVAVVPSFLRLAVDSLGTQAAGGSAPAVERICLPPYMRGGVYQFSAETYELNAAAGSCADFVDDESVVDNVTAINDPACGTDPWIADPTFESGNARLGMSYSPGRSTAQVIVDAAAHGGDYDVMLTSSNYCGNATMLEHIIVPPSSGDAGPAFKMFYKLAPGNVADMKVTPAATRILAIKDVAWHEEVFCLPPANVGKTMPVYFQLSELSNCNPQAISTAWIDDLSVTTDASCPP